MTRLAAPGSTGAAAVLGELLRAAGYGPEAFAGTGLAGPGNSRVAPALGATSALRRRPSNGSAADTLLQLFLCDAAVPPADAGTALGPLTVGQLASAGILRHSAAGVRSRVRIGWCDGVLVASDWDGGRRVGRHHVTGVGAASLTLADLTVRAAGVEALDMGTGSGIQALLTARHAASVLGTDINRRALELASLSAALNGTENVGWREGSLFEPVTGETFDLVTANPPFVVSPEITNVFRDAGLVGDTISRQVLRDAAAALRPGGWASVLCSWAHPANGDWAAPVRAWLADAGCDAWVLRYCTEDPVTYASVWAPQGAAGAESLDRTLDRWLAYYEELGIEALATGAVVLRRRSDGRSRVWSDDMPEGPSGPAGAQIVRAFDQRARLARQGGTAAVLDAVVAPLDGATLDQSLVRRGAAYQAAAVTLRLQPGLGVRAPVPPEGLPVVLGLDGQRTIGDLIAATGTHEVATLVVRSVRRLLDLGLVAWRP